MKVSDASDHEVSATLLTDWRPLERLVTNIRRVADVMVCPAKGWRSNLKNDSRSGEASDQRLAEEPKLLPGRLAET